TTPTIVGATTPTVNPELGIVPVAVGPLQPPAPIVQVTPSTSSLAPPTPDVTLNGPAARKDHSAGTGQDGYVMVANPLGLGDRGLYFPMESARASAPAWANGQDYRIPLVLTVSDRPVDVPTSRRIDVGVPVPAPLFEVARGAAEAAAGASPAGWAGRM